ncbi:SagB family peptide dehydrogenase [Amycolatopsis anabasis]|uniref:SagB family peptide dehydrogenase n=1 Tax=Amycolatopsis anabasis TaxID=1840409 RepID=UPI00131A9376|nr:SagB family peptide dehydrogenase [Amycolatopsis anabasis]
MGDPIARARAIHAALNGQSDDEDRAEAPESRQISLPDVPPPAVDLVETLALRRSGYAYAQRPLELAKLSALLRFAVGVQRFVPAYGVDEHPLGMAPSAGGLRCGRTYVVVREASGLSPGVYRYDAVRHALAERSTGDPTSGLSGVYLQPEFADRVPVSLALTTRLDVAFAKYPLRHYRTLHVDTGIAVQNLYLVGTALGLSCCAVAGYYDNALAELLGVPREELPVMLFAVGHPAR